MRPAEGCIDRVRRRANALAQPIIDAARCREATELDRARGDAARLILLDAERRAELLPADELDERVDAMLEWRRRRETTTEAEIAHLAESQGRNAGGAWDVRRRAAADLEERQAEFYEWIDGHALAAWIRATEDLLTLDRPSAFVPTQESSAQH